MSEVFCVDCQHHTVRYEGGEIVHRCMKCRDEVTGEPMPCRIVRHYYTAKYCGENATFFSKSNPSEEN